MVSLEPIDGKGSVCGASVENGKFLIEDVLPGEKIVRISAAFTKEITPGSIIQSRSTT